ncbi:MAG TPA: Crp/Fnr family transcriptional regulator [Thermoanaerobaculia bacterium]|nr:Crp/Fnr family transcriptional regulator [Thermoanaerobaculia bacterium]
MSAVVVDPAALGRLELFEGLSPQQLAHLNGLLRSASFPAGSNFITAEQPGEVIYVLLEGTVKIYISHPDGRDVILAFLGPGDTVGEMSLVDSSGRSANVVTTERSRVLWMDRATFQTCLHEIAPLANNLIRLLAKRLRFANEQIQSLCTLDVPGRLARQILALADRYGSPPGGGGEVEIPLRLTQSDLGEIVGASRERVNQVIVELKHKGLITVDANYRIRVKDRAELARYCG